MAKTWQEYQEEAAEFFRALDLEAATNVAVQGIRTSHDVDVLVKSRHVGFEITWIVECKNWHAAVSKLHVLGLRQIVTDIGADRGILLSESGFQSGAIEAAKLTNVHITSLAALQTSAKDEITSMRLRDLHDRIEVCEQRYWSIAKYDRINHGLRPEVCDGGYSGTAVIDFTKELLLKAFRGTYPVEVDSMAALSMPEHLRKYATPEELCHAAEPLVAELETKLTACEDLLHRKSR